MKIDQSMTPDGYKAVPFEGCRRCAFMDDLVMCLKTACLAHERPQDYESVHFIKATKAGAQP